MCFSYLDFYAKLFLVTNFTYKFFPLTIVCVSIHTSSFFSPSLHNKAQTLTPTNLFSHLYCPRQLPQSPLCIISHCIQFSSPRVLDLHFFGPVCSRQTILVIQLTHLFSVYFNQHLPLFHHIHCNLLSPLHEVHNSDSVMPL